MYDFLHYWLVFGSSLNETIEFIKDDTFSATTDFVIAIKEESTYYYTLYDVYNPAKVRGGHLNVTYYGSWDETNRLNVTLTMSKSRRRINLNKMTLYVGTIVLYLLKVLFM